MAERALHDHDDSPAAAVVAALCEYSRARSSIPKYSGLVYNGFRFSREREALQALVTETQRDVTGVVRLKLYKDNVIVAGRKSTKSLYDPKIATMEGEESA